MNQRVKPFVLMIMDGWGYSESPKYNAIAHAQTPNWDKVWQSYPKTFISGSGLDVGLPNGQMGNSEVGHLNLGAGRVVYQEFTRISKAIEEGTFFENEALKDAVDKAVSQKKSVHIMGLVSPGGVHSHEDHMLAMIDLAEQRGAEHIYIHAFLDGRDMPPRSAQPSLEKFQKKLQQLGKGRIASVIGRYYAMDRDQRWERIEAAYNMLTLADSQFRAEDAVTALKDAYSRDENDEFVKATIIEGKEVEDKEAAGDKEASGDKAATITDGDAVIFMNFRADRARQITRAFVEPDFNGFTRKVHPKVNFVCLTQYAADIPAAVAYPPVALKNVLGEYLQNLHMTQLRIAETEKYAHVTFFFNGGKEQAFTGEERILVNSPNVATYDLQPEMSAPELTDKLVDAIQQQKYDVIICNYANPDMVGHTGNFDAAVKAVECLDDCIEQVVTALKGAGGEAIITADHGNVEKMFNDDTGQKHTAHTANLVPFVYVGRDAEAVIDDGVLSDVAPTILSLLNIDIPQEMTGRPIFKLKN